MAQKIIDLSGRAGLSDYFAGDADMVTPQPNLRMESEAGGMASGFFNPYLRNTYLAPISTNQTSLTLDQTVTAPLITNLVDLQNGEVYWGSTDGQVFKGDSLSDSSLTRMFLETNASVSTFTLNDLEMYTIYGAKTMFLARAITYLHTSSEMQQIRVQKGQSTRGYINYIAGFNPASGSTDSPKLMWSNIYKLGTSDSITISDDDVQGIYIPTGRGNLGAIVIAIDSRKASLGSPVVPADGLNWASATEASVTTITDNTVYNPSINVSARVWYVYGIPNGLQGDINLNFGSTPYDATVFVYVFDNCLQSSSVFTSSGFTNVNTTTADTRNFTQSDVDSVAGQTLFGMLITGLGSTTTARHTSNGGFYQELLDSTVGTIQTAGDGVLYSTWMIEKSYPRANLATYVPGSGATDYNWIVNSQGEIQNLTTSGYNFLRLADNGFMYYFTDHQVHKIDGTITGGPGGYLTENVLVFPDTFRITDALDYRSRMYMALHHYDVNVGTTALGNFVGKCGVYVWNRISTQLSAQDYIELPGVREIKKIYASPEGVIKLITINDAGLTEVRRFGYNDSGGVVFPPIKTLGIGAFPQYPDGLTNASDKTMWIANDGNMYSEKLGAVTKLHQIKSPGTGTTGLTSNIATGAIIYGSSVETASNDFRTNKQGLTFSYFDSATHYIKRVYPFDLANGSNTAQAQHQGDVFTEVFLIPVTSVARSLRIYNAPTSSTGTTVLGTVKIYFNQSTSVGITKSITMNEAKRGYVDFNLNKPYIHSIQIEFEWPTSTNLSGDTYLPSIAIITYDETTTSSPDNG